MKFKIILIFLLAFPIENFATDFFQNTNSEITDKGRRNKNGQYRTKKHRLKKLIQGKRYCDCPKH